MTTTFAQRGRFAAIVIRVMERMGLNQTGFCHRIGVPDRTLRNWLNESRSPALDWLLINAHKLPDELVAAVLQDLAGTRFTVDPMPDVDVPPACIVGRAHTANVGMSNLLAELHAAKADGRITGDEAGRLLKRLWTVAVELKAISVDLTLLIGQSVTRSLARRSA